MKSLYVTEHVVLDGALHGDGLAVFILDTSITTVTRVAGHLLAKLLVQFSQGLVLFGLLRLRLWCRLLLGLFVSDVDMAE